MLSSFIGIVGAGMVNGLNTYLFRDYFGNVSIMAVSGMLSVLWSLIAFVGTKFVAKKFGKKNGLCTVQLSQLLFMLFYSSSHLKILCSLLSSTESAILE